MLCLLPIFAWLVRVAVPASCPSPVLTEAIDNLARQRTAYWLGDSAVHLHALASLIAQAQQLLPQAVHAARDQKLTWTQIGELLGISATAAARRYRNKP